MTSESTASSSVVLSQELELERSFSSTCSNASILENMFKNDFVVAVPKKNKSAFSPVGFSPLLLVATLLHFQSLTSVFGAQKKARTEYNSNIKEKIDIYAPLVIQRNGKLTPDIIDNKKAERLPILVSGNDCEKLLGVPKLTAGTGIEGRVGIGNEIATGNGVTRKRQIVGKQRSKNAFCVRERNPERTPTDVVSEHLQAESQGYNRYAVDTKAVRYAEEWWCVAPDSGCRSVGVCAVNGRAGANGRPRRVTLPARAPHRRPNPDRA
ncbi:hypothetical protein EVAR_99085_1 [Eumeta japonica]|uniref:Uncharacterized protein n=1 Tax=Eumeta variegata TaxID=151549 RepID=A0A4C1ZH62_EUMVA|nr:hypothetical protein EVAR_99085_1 [Eumeta japonica]